MKRLLFYNDAAGFGGHEMIMLTIIRDLLGLGCEVHLISSPLNRQLDELAGRIAGLKVHVLPFTLNRFNFLTNPVNLPKTGFLRRMIRSMAPDCVVAVQGNIEISSLVLSAARKEGLPVVSYMALGQTMEELGASWPRVRDAVDRYFLGIPDRFIITSASQERYLARRGVEKRRIALIPNVVTFEPHRLPKRAAARAALGISRDGFWFGLVARVVMKHKGHHYLVEAVKANVACLRNVHFLVVGDGPDLLRLMKRVKDDGIEEYFSFKPWTDDLYAVYAALDGVVMPSNHEGVPLVMIEAVLAGLPVIASDIDGMKDYLPPEWLFPRGDSERLAERVLAVASGDGAQLIEQTREAFHRVFLRSTIGSEFLQVIDSTIDARNRRH